MTRVNQRLPEEKGGIAMSIRSIDTQIMITRATDMVREASNIQRQPETTQSMLAVQTKAESAQDQSRVAATKEAEMENIRTDVDGEGSGAAGGEGKGQKGEELLEEETDPGLMVPPDSKKQLIDIKV